MIKNWFITGDTHGEVAERLVHMPHLGKKTALIILGDVGFNFHMDIKDKVRKQKASCFGTYIYCVRGNHEQRPFKMPFMVEEYDEQVGNFVWFEEEYPYIRYFQDGEIYNINDYKTLVLGGAYSIDKEFRLALGWPWFPGEQLNQLERDYIQEQVKGEKFDLILSHTCPISFCPTELFLKSIDQTKVDKTMENWLEEISNSVEWRKWLFGHYHANKVINPKVEMLYDEIKNLKDIMGE